MKPSFSLLLHLSTFFPVFSQWRKKMRYSSLLSAKTSAKRERLRERNVYLYQREHQQEEDEEEELSLSLFIWWWCYEDDDDAEEEEKEKKGEKWRARKKISEESLSTLLKKKRAKNGEKRIKTNRSTTDLSSNSSKNARDIYVFTSKQEAHIICWPTKGRRVCCKKKRQHQHFFLRCCCSVVEIILNKYLQKTNNNNSNNNRRKDDGFIITLSLKSTIPGVLTLLLSSDGIIVWRNFSRDAYKWDRG